MTEKKWASSLDVSEETILFKESIGKGSYGEVWSAVWCGSQVAAKTIHEKYFKKEYDQEIRDFYIGKLRNEWKVLQTLVHPNIVRMYKVLFPPHTSPVIVMELMHCDLLHYIESSTSSPKVSTSKGISIALGIAEGLEYLHGLKPPVVHRDIATKNILLTEDNQPKIADLGVARVFAAGKDEFATARPGTPLYAAPETYKKIDRDDNAKYGPRVDIFSFGVVVLVMNIDYEPVYLPINRPKGSKLSEVKKREKDIQQIKDPRIQQLVIHCLQEKGPNRPNASKTVTELRKIKDEIQGQEVQRDQAVTFQKVSPQPSYDFAFKVLFLGNRYVGKSCLFELLKNPSYKIEENTIQQMTMSIFPIIQWFQYNSVFVKMEIADTSGEERFFSLTANYYRDVDGVFLIYDVSNDESFTKLPFWINSLKKYNNKDNLQMLLVGNKMDLRQTMRPEEIVRKGRALAFANMLSCPYVETSAKNIDCVMAMYEKMVEILIKTVIDYADVRIQMQEENRQDTTTSTINLFTQSKRKVRNNCPSCKSS